MNRSGKRGRFLAAVLAMALAGISLHSVPLRAQAKPGPSAANTPLSLAEAEVLLSVMPAAQELHKKGGGIQWEQQSGAPWHPDTYYAFRVTSYGPASGHGSRTVGFFSVNKWTADVWDDMPKPKLVQSPGSELGKVQKVLRRSHHIGPATIEKYRKISPWK